MRSFALENLINIFYLKKSFVEGKHPRIELKSGILVQSDKQSEPPLFPSPNDSIVENIKKTRLNKIKDNNGMSNPIIDKEERQAKFESIKAKV
ncbi:MAG: hypothetical protein ACTTIZ_00950 [Treponema sp.]